ncbi:MAG: hypothetical protein WAZ94_05645, partial [Phycisphaerales bacterium]
MMPTLLVATLLVAGAGRCVAGDDARAGLVRTPGPGVARTLTLIGALVLALTVTPIATLVAPVVRVRVAARG